MPGPAVCLNDKLPAPQVLQGPQSNWEFDGFLISKIVTLAQFLYHELGYPD